MTELLTPAHVTERFKSAWNAHDMDLFATVFHPDATFVNRYGVYWRGVDVITNSHKVIHETIYRDPTISIDPPEVEMLSDDKRSCMSGRD